MAFSQRTLLDGLVITTALTNTIEGTIAGYFGLDGMMVEADFTYGSAGTTVDVFIQTTFDGTNWFDIMNFAFATTTARSAMAVVRGNVATPATLTDGTMTNDTSQAGLLGDQIRVKLLTIGTYATATTLSIRVMPRGGGT